MAKKKEQQQEKTHMATPKEMKEFHAIMLHQAALLFKRYKKADEDEKRTNINNLSFMRKNNDAAFFLIVYYFSEKNAEIKSVILNAMGNNQTNKCTDVLIHLLEEADKKKKKALMLDIIYALGKTETHNEKYVGQMARYLSYSDEQIVFACAEAFFDIYRHADKLPEFLREELEKTMEKSGDKTLVKEIDLYLSDGHRELSHIRTFRKIFRFY